MEEEIITPEEEVFNYHKLRYILTNDGYVCHASIGGFIVCDLGECTEYNGDVPDGYETIEEWYEAEIERLNSWKIVDGNLEFDPNKYEILQAKCEKEHEDNRPVCHKEISNLTNLVKSDNADTYLKSTSILSNFIEVTDSNKFASTYIELLTNENISNKLHIKFNNGNLLTNSATSKKDSGISFEVNADRTIKIKGTATNDIEYDIGGYPNNTKPILAFKKGINYYLSSNGHQIKMYNYDGVDREEIYSGTGGVIRFTDGDRKVTEIVLFIPNETKVNETLKPMLNVGSTAKEYITYEGNEAVVYLGEYTFYKGDNIKIDEGTPILQNEVYISDDLIIGDDFIIGGDLYYLDDIGMPITYLDLTYMYCMEDINLKVTYPNNQRNNDLTGYETPNGGFAIDEDGNMYCNNANIRGSAIVNGSNFNVDAAGNMSCNNATMNNANITGGKIELSNVNSTQSSKTAFIVKNSNDESQYIKIFPDNIEIEGDEFGTNSSSYLGSTQFGISNDDYNSEAILNDRSIWFHCGGGQDLLDVDGYNLQVIIQNSSSNKDPYFNVTNVLAGTFSSMTPNGVWSPSFNNNSLESKKKNIELDNGCLKEILESDIASFNWKYEDDEDQKHIGLIIADETGKYKVSPKALTHDKDAIDLYSMSGMAWKGIQELYNIVIDQQKKIKELEEKLNGIIESNKTN